jgi:hypothetical protein
MSDARLDRLSLDIIKGIVLGNLDDHGFKLLRNTSRALRDQVDSINIDGKVLLRSVMEAHDLGGVARTLMDMTPFPGFSFLRWRQRNCFYSFQ